MKRIVTSALIVFVLAAPAWGKDPVPAPKDKKPAPKVTTPVKGEKPKAEKAKVEKLDKITTSHKFAFKGDDSGHYAVQLKPGQPLEIMLDDNGASTGGLWVLTDADSGEPLASKTRKGWTCADAASGVLVMQGAPVAGEVPNPKAPAAGAAVGRAGTLKWSFVAKKEGRQTLRFVFRQAWEKPSEDELAVVYAVTVAKDAKPGVTVVPKKKAAP